MIGSEGVEYTEVLSTSLGTLGYRSIGNGFRVRLEPRCAGAVATPKFGSWKTPSGSGKLNRFSTVVEGGASLAKAIAAGAVALSSVQA